MSPDCESSSDGENSAPKQQRQGRTMSICDLLAAMPSECPSEVSQRDEWIAEQRLRAMAAMAAEEGLDASTTNTDAVLAVGRVLAASGQREAMPSRLEAAERKRVYEKQRERERERYNERLREILRERERESESESESEGVQQKARELVASPLKTQAWVKVSPAKAALLCSPKFV